MKPTVLILQEQVPPYRIPLFRALAEILSFHGFDLRVASSSALAEPDTLGFTHLHAQMSRGGLSALQVIFRERPRACSVLCTPDDICHSH